MIGTWTMIVNVIMRTTWICCTSLVDRVMSDGGPNRVSSMVPNPWTVPKTSRRMSRPTDIAVRAPR